MKFEWDENKYAINLKKHKVAFDDVINVFFDDCRLVEYDSFYSIFEERYIIIGKEKITGHIIFVSYCIRGERIRIISARYATGRERRRYYDSYL